MNPAASLTALLHADATVLVVAPHPDDESLAAGGLIQIALSRGARVAVAFLTDGDANPWPQRVAERRIRIGPRDRARWGARRRAEARAAALALGVGAEFVHHLGMNDLHLTSALEADPVTASFPLAELIGELRPTVVIAPALRDTHPDHSAAYIMFRLALANVRSDAKLFTYLVHGAASAGSEVIQTDAVFLARKSEAVEMHQTQLLLSRGRMLGYAARPEQFERDTQDWFQPTQEMALLPWRLSRVTAALARVVIVTAEISVSLRINHAGSPSVSGYGCRVTTDGTLVVALPPEAASARPVFARLASRISSPWIYDRWGWVQLA